MKATRTQSRYVRRNLPTTRSVSMRAVRDLLATIFNRAAPEAGVAIDFSDLTDAKLQWRRNLLTETEFRNGSTADTYARSGITSSSVPGFAGAIAFAAGVGAYGYKVAEYVAGQRYNISTFVKMDDGGAPSFLSANSTDATNDFVFVAKGDAAADPRTYVVEPVPGMTGVYRVSASYVPGSSTAAGNTGIVKYVGNSARTFSATGYQLTKGALTPYQALTDVFTEFLRDWPLHSLYREHTFQTPVMAMEDVIGGALDMRFGGLRGPELAVNGGFDTDTGWTKGGGWTISGGRAIRGTSGAGSLISQPYAFVADKSYEVTFDYFNLSTSFQAVFRGGTIVVGPQVASGSGRYRCILKANAGNNAFDITSNVAAGVGEFDNFSIREVYGNHAQQPTVNDRPVMSGRVNLLTKTEDLTDAVWTKQNGSSAPSANSAFLAWNGTANSADGFQQVITVAGGTAAKTVTVSFEVSVASGTATFRLKNTQAAVLDNFSPTLTATTTPTIFSLTVTNGASAGSGLQLIGLQAVGASNTFIVSKATMVLGAVPGPYQRVNTATDYDAIGFPKGARFNGVNSWMSIAALDMSGSDKLLFTASARKDSDAARACIMELSPVFTTPGSFGLFGPWTPGPDYLFTATGASGTAVTVGPSGLPAPLTAVLTGVANLAGATFAERFTARVNGASSPATFGATGGGNFTNATLYIGRRGGTTLPFNGMVYRIGIRSGLATDFIAAMERWANEPVKVLA